MKNSKFFPLTTLLLLLFFAIACKKDSVVLIEQQQSSTLHTEKYDWSTKEKAFFSLESPTLGTIQSRDQYKTFFHPKLIEAYDAIAKQNDSQHFVDKLAQKAGFPIWKQTFVHFNKANGQNLVIIPLARSGEQKVSAAITVHRLTDGSGRFVINGMSREQIINTSAGYPEQKLFVAKWIISVEKRLFGDSERTLKDAYCKYVGQIQGGAGPGGATGPELPPFDPCHWRLVEMCSDENTQTSWISGSTNIPFHLDHDQDGIVNSEDQDWHELEERFGITQQDFEHRVFEWWEEHYEDDYGGYSDYYDGLADPEINIPDSPFAEGYHDSFWDNLGEFFDGIGEGIADLWYEIFHDDGCWDGGVGPSAGDREIFCQQYYALDCGDGVTGDWWNDIVETAVCSSCDLFQDIERDRINKYWEDEFQGTISQGDFENVPWWGICNPYSPTYESCIDELFLQEVINRFSVAGTQLSDAQVNWLRQHKQHTVNMYSFLLHYEADPEAIQYANNHFAELMSNPDYESMVTASFGWTRFMWTIAKEVCLDKAIDIILNLIPGFNKKDEVKDAILALATGDWWGLTWEVGKIIAGQIPWVKALDACVEVRSVLVKLDKIYDLFSSIGDAAMKRAWNILDGFPFKAEPKYLKYVDDLKVPKFGWAPTVDHRDNFKIHFGLLDADMADLRIHHAVPQYVTNNLQNLGVNIYEMHSVENLRGIPLNALLPSGVWVHTHITNQWTYWWAANPNPTLAQILEHTQFIDNLYGHYFSPPIR